jgi:heptosyltransferase I
MSALGDVTLGLPVAMALKRARPDVRIAWVAQRGPDALLAEHPAVSTVIPFDRHGGWRAYADVRRRLAAEPMDVVLDLQVALKAGLVTALAQSPIKWGVDRARARDANWLFTNRQLPPRPRAHMADLFLEFAHALGVNPEPLEYGLAPSAAARAYAETTFGPRSAASRDVVLVLASSAAHKNWMPDRWAAVAQALVHTHECRVVLAGATSAVEVETAAAIQRAVGSRAVSTLGCGVANLLGVLERASLVIAPDTGPLHMAVALGRPVLGLYGSTNPKWVGPYRQSADALVDAYGDPGEAYPASPARREGRMARIAASDVIERVARVLR